MKIKFTLPNNEEFFHEYAPLINNLFTAGIVAQFVSAATEFSIIYAFVASKSIPGAWFIAAVFTAGIELILRGLTPYSVRAFLYQRFKGLHLVISVFVIAANLVFLSLSGYLSFKNSKDLVEYAMPAPDLETTGKADSTAHRRTVAALEVYRNDSTATAGIFTGKIEAEKNRFKARIEEQQSAYSRLKRLEQANKTSYRTQKDKIAAKIKALEAEQGEALAALEEQKAAALGELLQRKNQGLSKADSLHAAALTTINAANTARLDKTDRVTNRYGGALAWTTIFFLFLFLMSVVVKEVHDKGSGVKRLAAVNPYHFADGLFTEAVNLVRDWIEGSARTKLQQWRANLPAPPSPTPPPSLFDLEEYSQHRVKIAFEHSDGEKMVLPVPSYQVRTYGGQAPPATVPQDENQLAGAALDYLKAAEQLRAAHLEPQAAEMELKADDVLKCYLGASATPANVAELKARVIGYLRGKNENPFSHLHRQPIGFKNGSQEQPSNEFKQGETKIEAVNPYTVDHNGTPKTMAQINNLVSIYQRRLIEAKAKQDENLAASRLSKLEYWQGKKQELEAKIKRLENRN